MAFETELDGHKLVVDADESAGGNDTGIRPKKLLLTALAGCTGMDVVSLLKKMHVPFESFNIRVDGKLAEDHPKYYETMHITYELKGTDLPLDKIQKAVELSQEKYCSVSALFKKAIPVTWEIKFL